jgi:hypothetical protein
LSQTLFRTIFQHCGTPRAASPTNNCPLLIVHC